MVSSDIRYSSAPEHWRHMGRGRPKFTLPLHFAIWNKLTVEARCLVEGGADVDAQDDYGRTPLMMCCMENDEDWSTGIATMLMQAGVNASLYDANGRNALMFSLIFKRRRMTELLLKSKDYDLHKKDKSKRTVLDYAIMTGELPTFSKTMRESRYENSGKRPASSSPEKPSNVCKTIIRDTLTSAKVYAPSSEMNTHQFRRLVKGEVASKNIEKDTKGKTISSGRTTKSSLVQRNQLRATSARNSRRPSTALPAHVKNTRSAKGKNETANARPKSASWKSIVPLLWNTLSIQHCPSYCPPATPVTQTYEEALGLPPIEDNESTIISEDGLIQDDTEQAIPRRSSMPTSYSSHPSYKLRRRSEAIGMSTNSLTKFFFSEKKVGDGFEQPMDIDQKAQDQSNITKTPQRRRLRQTEAAEDTIDSAPDANIASYKQRSNSISTISRSSFPRPSTTGNNIIESRRASVAVTPTNVKTKPILDKPAYPENNDDVQNQPNGGPPSPVKTQQLMNKKRRRESVLRETALLPNIIEEQ